MKMYSWLETAPAQKKAMPILSFPGHQITGATVEQLVGNSDFQAECMLAIAQRYDTLASVSLMDLSVEAEAFGSKVRFDDKDVPTVTDIIVTNEEDADALKIPKVGAARTGIYVDAISKAVKSITDRPVFAGLLGPFSLAGRLMGVSEILLGTYKSPEAIHKTLDKVAQFTINYALAYKEAGANGILMAEPVAGLLSPKLIAKYSCPYVKRIIEAVEDENFLVIYHNCGASTVPSIEHILSMGARAMHFGNAIDLGLMAKSIPADRVFLGNVDPASEFCQGTPESVKATTLKVLEACAGYPNFIISSGCDVPPQTPLDNIDSFFNTVKEFYKK